MDPASIMASSDFPVVNPKPILKGSAEFEAKCSALRSQLTSKFPDNLRLPLDLIRNPPKNVTSIPRSCGLLSAEEIEITEKYDAVSLTKAIAESKLTSVDVVKAFAKRAVIAHQLTGCLTDFFLEEALAQAQALDQHLAQTGNVVGPLHGLPISIKEIIDIAGHQSSTGYIGDIRLAQTDSHIVSALRRQGAVFYVKTGQPQGVMHLEGDGYLYRILNPYNIHLSSGGSSSGESALIALRGSLLGVGTDIGGSIRGPAAFCGIWGFKPTSRLFPRAGVQTHQFTAALNIDSTCGPMSSSLGGVELFIRSVLGTEPHKEDGELWPKKWTPSSPSNRAQKKLRIGVMMDDGNTVPQPPVTLAMEWAVEKLKEAKDRFELVPYIPYKAAESPAMLKKWYYPIGTQEVRKFFAAYGEPELPLTTPNFEGVQELQLVATEILEQNVSLSKFRREFTKDWHRQGVDVVLSPSFVGPASMHDTADNWIYTSIWNIQNYPSAVFPTHFKADGSYKYNDPHRAQTLSQESAAVYKLWQEGDYQDAPINLQLIAPFCFDEELYEAMQSVVETLGVENL